MSSMSSTFPSLFLSPVCITTYLMTWTIFQQLQGKWKMLERQKCHTDSISPCLHSTNCDRAPSLCFGIGSVWVVGVSSPSLSEEQELCKAVLSGNWSILSAREVHLQMIRDGMCSRAFFLCLRQKNAVYKKVACALHPQTMSRKKEGRPNMIKIIWKPRYTSHKLRQVVGTRASQQLVLYLKWEDVVKSQVSVVPGAVRGHQLAQWTQGSEEWMSGFLVLLQNFTLENFTYAPASIT